MSANVGLSTPRGSGTSGYVQRNLSALKPRSTGYGQPYSLNDAARPPKIRKPDEDILRHDRLREIEVKVLEVRDRLEEEGQMSEDGIEEECERERVRLVEELERGGGKSAGRGKVKGYQVHELAEAKAKESERLRRALGLKGDVVGGAVGGGEGEGEHPMARQERRKREVQEQRGKREVEGEREGKRERRRFDDD